MKILYLINYAGKSGIEKYVENLVHLFEAKGAECHLAYNLPGELSKKLEGRIKCLRLSLEWKDALSAAGTLADYCRENGIDVIHAQCPRENVIALLAKRRNKALRVVYTSHFTTPCGSAWRMINRVFTPQNDCIIAVCRECRDVLIENGCCKDKIRVIYNGVEPAPLRKSDTLRRELELEDGIFLLTTLARFDPEKGLDFLVRSLHRLRTMTNRPFCCTIAGDGVLFPEIKSLTAELGMEKEIQLLGYRTDAPDILASADAYVCSSKCNEAFSFGILEAMNSGLPCIVTDVGGNRDMVESGISCGTVVDYGDEAAFADALLELMENTAKRESMAKNAREKVAVRFDLNKLADDVYGSYFA